MKEDKNTAVNTTVSVGNWMLTLFLTAFPVVNLITYLCNILGSKRPTKRNWAVAHLCWGLVGRILAALLVVVMLVVFFAPFKTTVSDIWSYVITTPVTKLNMDDIRGIIDTDLTDVIMDKLDKTEDETPADDTPVDEPTPGEPSDIDEVIDDAIDDAIGEDIEDTAPVNE